MALRSSVASQASAKASGRIAPRRMAVCVRAQQQEQVNVGRREFLQASAASALLLASPGTALAAKGPKGFNPVQDLNDNYEFFYPFGWQEVSIQGADVVFKDVIEPLESVSVTITSTDRSDITEFGSLEEVTETLARSVLSSPDQQVKVIKAEERDSKGHKYYGVEFTANNGRFTRHQLAVVTVNDGKFYTLTTGSAEKRWGKMGDKLQTVANTFQLIN